MAIPDKVKIAGHTVNVVKNHKFKERSDCAGLACYYSGTIYLSEEAQGVPINDDHKNEMFLHELLHHIFHIYRVLDDDEEDEMLVTRLAGPLYQVLKDNKLYFGEKQDLAPGSVIPVDLDTLNHGIFGLKA